MATVALAVWATPAFADVAAQGECVAIQGDEYDHEEHEEARQRRIDAVLQAGDHVSIVYYEDPNEPAMMRLRGVELVDASIEEGVAKIRLEDEAGLPCSSGIYELSMDDSLGRDLAVVAVLDDAVLLQHDDELRYISVGNGRLDWNLIWRSRFSVAPPRTGKGRPARAVKRPARRAARRR